jgi:integrase/recombinase XerD
VHRLNLDPLTAGIHHADVYLRPLAAASIARRRSALHGFYRYAARHGAVTGSPFTDASRPAVDDESMATGLTRDEVRALLTATRAHSPRSAALISLLLFNGLRISEALDARIEDLSYDRGTGCYPSAARAAAGPRSRSPPTCSTPLDAAIGDRTTGPISATGNALDRSAA